MWSSTEENNYNSNTTKCHNKRLVSSSSSSSTSSSSPSPSPLFSPSSHLIIPTSQRPTNTTKTMEEVWKDINLSNQDSLSSDINHRHSHSNFRGNGGGAGGGFILQDFLARPFNKDPPPRAVAAADICLFGSPAPPPPPPPPPHAPILSLNPDHHGLHLETPNILNVSSFNDPLDVIVSSSGLLPSFGKKRLPESDENPGGGDRRHKRMIKNRESAARSRARKQECHSLDHAYTNELELEVAHLMEENARLKRQQEQLCMAAAAAAQLPKKHTLHRTSTAPF